MAELADALDSGSSSLKRVWVQIPSSAPKTGRFYCRPVFLCFYCGEILRTDHRSRLRGIFEKSADERTPVCGIFCSVFDLLHIILLLSRRKAIKAVQPETQSASSPKTSRRESEGIASLAAGSGQKIFF